MIVAHKHIRLMCGGEREKDRETAHTHTEGSGVKVLGLWHNVEKRNEVSRCCSSPRENRWQWLGWPLSPGHSSVPCCLREKMRVLRVTSRWALSHTRKWKLQRKSLPIKDLGDQEQKETEDAEVWSYLLSQHWKQHASPSFHILGRIWK